MRFARCVPYCALMHPAALPDDELLKACETVRGRRGGPGGQHRNKVETAVRLTHTATGTIAEASERRSQRDNHRAAVFRLRIKLAVAVRAPWTEPSPLWLSRCVGGRIAVNPEHTDAPAILAESLDAAAALGWEDKATATRLREPVAVAEVVAWIPVRIHGDECTTRQPRLSGHCVDGARPTFSERGLRLKVCGFS